jgi:hypothetical protein
MDVMTAYLYGSLDSDIYTKVPDGISVPNANVGCNMYCVKLHKSFYGLKYSRRMWYNRLKKFLLNKGYSNNLNIIGTELDINEARDHLKMEFEMKDLGKTKFYLGLQLDHLPTGILIHQSAYVHSRNSHGHKSLRKG